MVKSVKKSVKKSKAALVSDIEDGDACLRMIRDQLECLGIEMDACPPLFYPEAIHNLYVWTAFASRDCQVKHGWHRDNTVTVAKCIKKWIQTKQKSGGKR